MFDRPVPHILGKLSNSVTTSVSPSQARFVVHDPSQGASIFDLETLERIPDALIPYSGSRIAIPITYSHDGRFLFVGEGDIVKVYDAIGMPFGNIDVGCGQYASTVSVTI